MNYFTHGRRFLHDPYLLAGTAVPDWLNVVDRRIRARSKAARPFLDDPDPVLAAIARGVIQHHHDDQWFHQTRAFAELSLDFTLRIRDQLPGDAGFRPSFLGHILVELLLDATLIAEEPERIEQYYQALSDASSAVIAGAVSQITGHDVGALALLVPRFLQERFLCDYIDDGKLLTRLNHVMRRVGLPALPEGLTEVFPAARRAVARRRDELLAGEAPGGPLPG